MITATPEPASHCRTVIAAGVSTAVSAAITVTTPVAVATTVAITVSTAVAVDATVSVAITTTEPRTGTDEDTAAKPRRAIVSIWRASVRSIAVVAIGANRSRVAVTPIHRATDADPNRNLGMRVSRCRDDQNSE
jgi:hypothetical protein